MEVRRARRARYAFKSGLRAQHARRPVGGLARAAEPLYGSERPGPHRALAPAGDARGEDGAEPESGSHDEHS
jgi:hypothetical protein